MEDNISENPQNTSITKSLDKQKKRNKRAKKRPNQSPEESEYKRISSFLLWATGIVGTLLTALAVVVVTATYNDRKSLKEDFDKTVIDLKTEIKELKTESKIEVKDVTDKLKEKQLQITEDISTTRTEAMREVASIKTTAGEMARTEASRQIDQVLNHNNFDEFVARVAKERMEPQIKTLVDNSVKSAEAKQIQKSVDNLLSDNYDRHSAGYNYFVANMDFEFTDSQQLQIVEALGNQKMKSMYRAAIANLIERKETVIFTNFFKKSIFGADRELISLAIDYFTYKANINLELLEKAIINALKHDPEKAYIYAGRVYLISAEKPDLAIKILNSRPIVDFLYTETSIEKIEAAKKRIVTETIGYLNKQDIYQTYFFTRK